MPAVTLPAPQASLSTVSGRRTVRIFGKPTWSDEWQELEYVEALQVNWCASPGATWATFRYRAGQIKREDKTFFSTDGPLDIDQWFVKVLLDPVGGGEFLLMFLGRFSRQAQDIGGVNAGELDKIPVDQVLTAYGLESLLDRIQIDASACLNKAGDGFDFTGTATPFRVDNVLVFNERFGVGINDFGNRTAVKKSSPAGRNSYLFGGKQAGGTASDPQPWTAYDIVEYLYAWFVPDWMTIDIGTPTGGGSPNVWDALAGYVFKYAAEGKSVKQVLDELITRQRGLGWWLKPIDGPEGETFKLEVFSIVNADVTVDDKTLPANPNQVIIPVYSIANRQVTYSIDDLTRYGSVRVVGERLLASFTVSFADSTLEKAWTTEEETNYESVAGANAYAKDVARNAEKFNHVWTTYRIPRNWDWTVKNGENAGDSNPVNPLIDRSDGSLTDYGAGFAASRDFGHKFLRSLPLRKQQLKEDAEPEFREPFAVIKLPDNKWQYVDRIFLQQHPFPCTHVRPTDTDMGIQLTVNPNHLLAKGSWNWSNSDSGADKTMAMDYRKIAATVAVETDQRLTVEVSLAAADAGKVKTIEIPDAAMWIVAPGTIIDVKADGSLDHYSGTTVIRNDGPRLKQIAALAKAFYGVPRATLQLSIDDIYNPKLTVGGQDYEFTIGTYVNQVALDKTGIILRTVNTVITEISFDLQAQTTFAQTSFAELDVKVRTRESNATAAVPVLDEGMSRTVVRGLAKPGKGRN